MQVYMLHIATIWAKINILLPTTTLSVVHYQKEER